MKSDQTDQPTQIKVRKNLIGRRFGQLKVTSRVPDYVSPKGQHKAKCHCTCDCGNEVDVNGDALKNGSRTNCGAFVHRKAKRFRSLVGRRFGSLVVQQNSGLVDRTGRLWDCKCDCGKHVLVSTSNLNSGQVKSCGHLKGKGLSDYAKKRALETPGANPVLLTSKKSSRNTSGR